MRSDTTKFDKPFQFSHLPFFSQYDIVLDVLIVNQTSDTLQSCTLELATLGDLKLVERPQPVVLAPMDFCRSARK
jgi:coatomer subunit beta